MAAPVVASTGAQATMSGTAIPVPVASGVTSGSLVIAFVWGIWGNSPTVSAITPPAGFTIGGSLVYEDTEWSVYNVLAWYYKRPTASDSGTYSFALASVGGLAAALGYGYSQRITGAATSGNPFVDTFQSAHSSSPATSIAVSSFTPGADASLFVAGQNVDENVTPGFPSGWTIAAKYQDATNGNTVAVGHAAQTTAAATGTLTFTSSAAHGMGVLIGTIRPPGGTQYPVTGKVAGTSAVSGVVTARRSSSGLTAAVSEVSGAPTARLGVMGTVRAESATSGAVAASSPVSGTIDAHSGISAAMGATLTIAGTTAASSTVSGAVEVVPHGSFAITGTVTAVTTSTGAVTSSLTVAGDTLAGSTVLGTVIARKGITGTAVAVSDTLATVSMRLSITGTINAISTARGAVTSSTDILRDITLTATLAPRRWGGILNPRTMTGTLNPRRWNGTLT